MKTPILIAAAFFSAAALAALAADPPKDAPKQLTPQQQRMSDCSKAGKGLKGDEHRKFMSDCLKKGSTVDVSKPAVATDAKPEPKPVGMPNPKGKPATPDDAKGAGGKQTQQDKMKSCNKLADKDKLKGDARQKFMGECLKNQA